MYTSRQRQVWLGGLQRTHAVQDEKVVRVYFDKFGDLYPDKRLSIPFKSFFDPIEKKSPYKENLETGNLSYFYKVNQNDFKTLMDYYNVQPASTFDATFIKVQDEIETKNASILNQLLNASQQKTLVILIHGFNDSDPTGDYQQIRDEINKLTTINSKDLVYLEVFWDGLTANQGDPVGSFIWGRAQRNAQFVSIGLRQLLSKVEEDTNVRIITHSSGGIVATGTLFNTITKWNYKEKFNCSGENTQEYKCYAEKVETPKQKNIRLGMLAPAIPGSNTFTDFHLRGSKTISNLNENNIERIALGINRNDYAVTKRAAGRDNSGVLGATSLGCDYKNEIHKSKEALKNGPLKLNQTEVDYLIRTVDFTNKTEFQNEHGTYYYLLQKNKASELIKLLFEV